MTSATGIARLPDGTFQRLEMLQRNVEGEIVVAPLRRRLTSDVVVSVSPAISGTVAPGNTVTATGGTYTGATLTRVRFRWTQRDSSGAIYASGAGASFLINADSPTGTLILTEELVDALGVAYSYTSPSATVTRTSNAPAFTSQPTVTGNTAVGSVLSITPGIVTGTPTPTSSYAWRRGTTVLSASGLTYTTVAADVGNLISARQTATNTAGTAVSNWTAGRLITSGGGTTYNVSTAAQLTTALDNSVAGDTILVAPGSYGTLNLGNRRKAGGQVTLRSANQADPAEFSSILGNSPAGWIIDNFLVGPATAAVGQRQGNCIQFDSTARSQPLSPTTRPPESEPRRNPLLHQCPERITLRNLLCRNREFGIAFPWGCIDVIIEACEIFAYQHDALRCYNKCDNLIIRNNWIHGCVPLDPAPDHRDCIQFAVNWRGHGGGSAVIENNYLDTNTAAHVLHQTTMLHNGVVSGTGSNSSTLPDHGTGTWENDAYGSFIIRNNFVVGRYVHGLAFGATKNVLVERNTLRRGPAGSNPYRPNTDNVTNPRVSCTGISQGIVRNNIVASATFWGSNGATAGMFEQFEQTASATAFPTGWVDFPYGRFSLG